MFQSLFSSYFNIFALLLSLCCGTEKEHPGFNSQQILILLKQPLRLIGPVLQPLRWCCVDCMIHHERDVREE